MAKPLSFITKKYVSHVEKTNGIILKTFHSQANIIYQNAIRSNRRQFLFVRTFFVRICCVIEMFLHQLF